MLPHKELILPYKNFYFPCDEDFEMTPDMYQRRQRNEFLAELIPPPSTGAMTSTQHGFPGSVAPFRRFISPSMNFFQPRYNLPHAILPNSHRSHFPDFRMRSNRPMFVQVILSNPEITPSCSPRQHDLKAAPSYGMQDHGLRLLSACTESPRPLVTPTVDSNRDQTIESLTQSTDCSKALLEQFQQAHNHYSVPVPKLEQLLLCAEKARGGEDNSVCARRTQPGLKSCIIENPTKQMKTDFLTEVNANVLEHDPPAKKCRIDDNGGRGDNQNESLRIQAAARPCKCNRSQCLKLYCECYSRGKLCNLDFCKCLDCHNVVSFSGPGGARTLAVARILARRTNAFERQVKKKTGEGCSCKKTRCLKKYCDCFALKTTCSSKCKCTSCWNTETQGDVVLPLEKKQESTSIVA